MAIYIAKEGGYINNIQATRQLPLTNPTIVGAGYNPETRAISRNDHLVEDNFNDATYEGFRLGMRWAPSDDWDVIVQHTTQTIDTQGVWDYDPTLGDLNSVSFQPDYAEDEFELTTWTASGRMANLELLYRVLLGSRLRVFQITRDTRITVRISPTIFATIQPIHLW